MYRCQPSIWPCLQVVGLNLLPNGRFKGLPDRGEKTGGSSSPWLLSGSETRSGRESSSLSGELDRSVSIQFSTLVFALAMASLSRVSRMGCMLLGWVLPCGFEGVITKLGGKCPFRGGCWSGVCPKGKGWVFMGGVFIPWVKSVKIGLVPVG